MIAVETDMDRNKNILIDRHEAAALLSVSPRVISDLVRRREIPFVRTSRKCLRFRRPSLERWATSREVQPY